MKVERMQIKGSAKRGSGDRVQQLCNTLIWHTIFVHQNPIYDEKSLE